MSSVDSTELTYSCDILFAISFVILVWCRHHRHRVELILSIAHMPVVGPSIDRRVFRHIRISESEEAVRALICFCCARVFASTSGNSEIAYANMEEYFDRINARSFEMNWDCNEYKRRYMQHGVLLDHPDLAPNTWTWRRRLRCNKYKGHTILCCPEDIHCKQLIRGRHG